MPQMFLLRPLALLVASCLLSGSPPAAHAAGDPTDGHTHAGEEAVAAPAGPPTAEAEGSLFEAALELGVDHLLIWVDDRATNAPVGSARLTVTIGDRDVPARPLEPGTFRVDLPEAPTEPFVVALAIEAPAGADLLEATLRPAIADTGALDSAMEWRSAAIGAAAMLGLVLLALAGRALLRRRALSVGTAMCLLLAAAPLFAQGGEVNGDGATALVSGSRPMRLADGQVFLPKPSQRILGVRTLVVETGGGAPALRIAGRVVADPSRSAQVATATGGRLEPVGPVFPRVGQAVRAGEVLLVARPALDAAAAQASASELRALDREIALADADHRRLSQLEGVVARADIERARLTLLGLRAQRAAAARPVQSVETLRAPIGGRVTRVMARVGELAQPGQLLLEIEGAGPVLVEAAATPALTGRSIRSAEAATAGGVRVSLRLVGRSPGLEGGVERLQFAPAGSGGVLRTGETVTLDLILAAEPAAAGLVVPAQALVRDGGAQVLFVKMSPTRFQPRVVRARPLAGGALLVEAGLAAGDRVVSEGAALLAQVR